MSKSKLYLKLLIIVLSIGLVSCSKSKEAAEEEKQAEVINTKPKANAGEKQTISKGSLVTLDASNSSDKENDALTYKWRIDSNNPSLVVLSDLSVKKPTFTAPDKIGDYTFYLIVNDGKEDSIEVSVVISVIDNSPDPTPSSKVKLIETPKAEANLVAIAFGHNLFVAVGYYGNTFNNEDRGYVIKSTDGENWTEITSLIGGESWKDVVFKDNKFIISGTNGAYAYSDDGTNWTKSQTTEARDWYSILYDNNQYIFTSSNARFASVSKDFNTQTIAKSNYNDDVWYDSVYANNKYVFVGNGGRVGYSSDNTNWTFKTIDKVNYSRLTSVCYGNSGFVATFGSGSKRVALSTDGENWSVVTKEFSIQAIAYVNNNYVLMGTHLHNNKIYLSSDLDFSTVSEFEAECDFKDACYGQGKYIVVGNKIVLIEN